MKTNAANNFVSQFIAATALSLLASHAAELTAGPIAVERSFNATDRGGYKNNGSHTPSNDNYFAGYSSGGAFNPSSYSRNFFVFDLPDNTEIYNAALRLWNPANGVQGTYYYDFYISDVSTPINTLRAGGTGRTDIYSDLGSGTAYGWKFVSSADNSSFITVPLYSSFVTEANAANGGAIAVGGRMGGGTIFAYSGGGNLSQTQLVLSVADDPAVTGDQFGASVSFSGGIGLIGAGKNDIQTNANQGSAYVFRNLGAGGGVTTQSTRLTASDGGSHDNFGSVVSLSGNMAVIGAAGDDITYAEQGSAYVFRNLNLADSTKTQDVKLTASDAKAADFFGSAVSLSGHTALVGATQGSGGNSSSQGSAYIFRNLDVAGAAKSQDVKLTASDGAGSDYFGAAVSLSGNTALVGAYGDQDKGAVSGAAYVFRNLDGAGPAKTQDVKLTASDGAAFDHFGLAVSLSGNTALVGAWGDDEQGSDSGSAYLFRNLDGAGPAKTQDVKLTASDGAASDHFGLAVSLSGNTAIVGAYGDGDKGSDSGSAYIFRNLNAATDTIHQNVKVTASDGVESDQFGISVSLDGDNFLIGADGKDSARGKAYSGSVSSITTLDAGNTSRTIDGISFTSQDDWIIGQSTDHNAVSLSSGDTATVAAPDKKVYIGRDSGSDSNTLIINGMLATNEVRIGGAGNTGNLLVVNGVLVASNGISVSEGSSVQNNGTINGPITLAEGSLLDGDLSLASGDSIGGGGTIDGNLTLAAGALLDFTATLTLTVTGMVSLDSSFGIASLVGLDNTVAAGTYVLIDGTNTDFANLSLQNWGMENAYALGGGKSAYFKQGSLEVQVVPEPGTAALLLLGAGAVFFRRKCTCGNRRAGIGILQYSLPQELDSP